MRNKENKYLVLGANGFVGEAVAKEISSLYPWEGTCFSRPEDNLLPCDVTSEGDIKRVFDLVRPAFVIHCINLSGGVKFCEKNPALAKKMHYDSTVKVGHLCQKYGAKLVFISSECVFDGKKESYGENDPVNPLSAYGRYKAESEIWIKDNVSNYLIVRSMSVFGWQPKTLTPNALMSLYFALLKGKKIFVPSYRWGTPTYVKDLAKAIVELCQKDAKGIFHVAGGTFISRYEWLKKTSDLLGWDSSLVFERIEMEPGDAVYPLKVRLDTRKFKRSYKTRLHRLEEALTLLHDDVFSPSRETA